MMLLRHELLSLSLFRLYFAADAIDATISRLLMHTPAIPISTPIMPPMIAAFADYSLLRRFDIFAVI